MSFDKIAESLGLDPIEEEEMGVGEEATLPAIADSQELDFSQENMETKTDEVIADIDKAKARIDEMIEIGMDGLRELVLIAKAGESTKHMESAMKVIETLVTANKEFVEMSKTKKYESETAPKGPTTQQNITNNNLILSTNDLLDSIIAKQATK